VSTSQVKWKSGAATLPGVRQAPGRTDAVGPMSGFRVPPPAVTVFVVRVRGHEVAWGSGTGGQTAGEEKIRGKGGPHTPLDRPLTAASTGLSADTAVSIEREVVSGHDYAIPAPQADTCGGCGYNRPTVLSVNGVSDP